MNNPEPQPDAKADPQSETKPNTPPNSTPEVSKRAYELYEERGRQGDPAVHDWEQAKQEVGKGTPKAEPTPDAKDGAKPEAKTARSSFIRKNPVIAGLVDLAVLAAVAVGFVVGLFWERSKKDPNRLVLYGNVDLREVELSFNNSERIAEVLVQEGDRVARGQILARLDTSRLKPEVAEAEAEVETQQAVVEKLHHGSRPEEISQAQADVASTKADQVNAQEQWKRMTALAGLTTGRATVSKTSTAQKPPWAWRRAGWMWRKRPSICPRSAQGRKTSPKGRRNCAPLKPNSNSCAGNWWTPNLFLRSLPWCDLGSWSLAIWRPPRGPFSIWQLWIQSGLGPMFLSLIWEGFIRE